MKLSQMTFPKKCVPMKSLLWCHHRIDSQLLSVLIVFCFVYAIDVVCWQSLWIVLLFCDGLGAGHDW